jgi:hypothetical protein
MDKKSDHVGNHGGRYTDIDGQTKQFTYVDHDRHTSRLKSWDYTKKESQMTELQELIDTICVEQVNELPQFIQEFDTILAKKYGFERYRKGKTVRNNQMDKPYEGEDWFNDLKNLYERSRIQKTIGRKNP